MEHILNQIHSLLIKNKKKIAIAESCTGGLLSNLLTRIPGSSHYFILGIVAYSNKAKGTILKIPAPLINKRGAVSKEVAKKMAKAIRKLAQSHIGIAITGIAGPGGGTPQKPKGTIFIAIDSKTKKISERFIFKGNRLAVRKIASLKALRLLKRVLKK